MHSELSETNSELSEIEDKLFEIGIKLPEIKHKPKETEAKLPETNNKLTAEKRTCQETGSYSNGLKTKPLARQRRAFVFYSHFLIS